MKKLFGTTNIKLALVLIVLIAFGLLTNRALDNNINNKITETLSATNRTQDTVTPTSIIVKPTDSPTPITDINCTIGLVTLSIPKSICDKAQAIQTLRIQDSAIVQKIIDNLNGQMKPLSDTLVDYNNQMDPDKIHSTCVNSYPSPTSDPSCAGPFPSPYTEAYYLDTQAVLCNVAQSPVNPSLITSCVENMESNINYLGQLVQNQLSPLLSQRDWYQNYLNTITNGIGNGACSDHGGVSCISGRTNIGQVICRDGWTGSSVYYFNVKECLNYYLSSN